MTLEAIADDLLSRMCAIHRVDLSDDDYGQAHASLVRKLERLEAEVEPFVLARGVVWG